MYKRLLIFLTLSLPLLTFAQQTSKPSGVNPTSSPTWFIDPLTHRAIGYTGGYYFPWLTLQDTTNLLFTKWQATRGNNDFYGVNNFHNPTYVVGSTLGIQPGANLGFVSSLSTTHGHWQWTSSDLAPNTSSLEATFWNTSSTPVSGLKFLPDNNGTIKDYSGVSFAKSTDIQKFLPSDSTKIAYIDSTGKIALSPSFLFKQGIKSGVSYQKLYLGYPSDANMRTKDGGLMLWGRAGGIDPRVVTIGYGASTGLSQSNIALWNVGGTIDAPTATAANTLTGEITWASYDGVSNFRASASIDVVAMSAATPTNAEGRIDFRTTPFGGVIPLTALTINSDQSVQATNLFTAMDLKASGAAAKVSTDAHLTFPDKAIVQWSTPSLGSAFIQGTQEATTLAGRGLWNLSNAYFDGTNWRQPRGTGVGSYLSSGSYENGFVWRYAPPNGVDGGTISPVNVMQLNNAGALTLNYDATHLTTFTPSSAGNLLIAPNGTSLNINSNVGIGTSTLPLNTFEVTKSVAGALGPVFSIINPNTTTTNSQVQLKFNPSNSTARYAYINSTNDGANNVSLAFGTGSGASITDKLTISGTGLINLPLLTASKPVYTDASKNLTSTGPGTSSQIFDGTGALITALPNGITATTQTAGDNSTKVATTAFVGIAIGGYVPTSRTISTGYGLNGGGNLASNLTLTADTTKLVSQSRLATNLTGYLPVNNPSATGTLKATNTTGDSFRPGYDASNYLSVFTNNVGYTLIRPVGTSPVLALGSSTSDIIIVPTLDPTIYNNQVASTAYVYYALKKVINTATDANYGIAGSGVNLSQFIEFPTITANRNITMPASSPWTGVTITLWNQNSSGFSWLFTGATVKDKTGATVTTLPNSTIYQLIYDGSNWILQ